MDWWKDLQSRAADNKSLLLMGGAGLLSGNTPQQGIANMAQMAMVGSQLDTRRGETAKRNEQRNRTMDYFKAQRPDLYAQVEAGMPVAEAWKIMYQKKPERKTEKDAAGRLRYLDDGSYAFQDVQVPGPKPTTLQQNLAAAGYEPGTPEYQQQMNKALFTPKSQTTVNNNLGGSRDVEMNKELGRGVAKNFNTLADQMATGKQKEMQLNQLESLFSQFDSGGGAAFKQVAGNFGIDTEGLSDIQAAQAIINSMVPQQRVAGSGPMSDADLELFKQSLPRLINTPGGNARIVEYLRGINSYQMQQAQIAQQVQMGQLTPQQGFEALHSLENPLSGLQAAMLQSGTDNRANMYSEFGLEPPQTGE